jgi:hypothetical protein
VLAQRSGVGVMHHRVQSYTEPRINYLAKMPAYLMQLQSEQDVHLSIVAALPRWRDAPLGPCRCLGQGRHGNEASFCHPPIMSSSYRGQGG